MKDNLFAFSKGVANSFFCFYVLIALLMLGSLGCYQATLSKHLLPTSGYQDTFSKSLNFDRSVDFSNYKTFAIIDPDDNTMNQLSGLNGSITKYQVSEELEILGYTPVFENQKPDMLVTISGRVDSSSTRISGGTGVLPIWRPGKTYTYSGTSNTNFNAYSSYGTSYYGNIYGSQFGSARSSGSMDYIPYQRPDYTVQTNHAQLVVAAFDAETKKELVIARSSANTFSADPSMAMQFLVYNSLFSFPPNEKEGKEIFKNRKWKGSTGFQMSSFSFDGGNLRPRVTYVIPNSPAMRAGLKINDIIVSINGIDTENIPVPKLVRDIVINPGDLVLMRIWRGEGNFRELSIKAKSLEEVYKK